MVGPDDDVGSALHVLERAEAELHRRLEREPAWLALRQLDDRERSGNPLAELSSPDLRARLIERLDLSVPEWRRREALALAISTLKAAGYMPTTASKPPIPIDVGAAPEPIPSGAEAARGPAPFSGPIAARNRSLTEALGAMQAIAAEPVGRFGRHDGVAASTPKPMAPESVLRRIRSLSPPDAAPEARTPSIAQALPRGDAHRPMPHAGRTATSAHLPPPLPARTDGVEQPRPDTDATGLPLDPFGVAAPARQGVQGRVTSLEAAAERLVRADRSLRTDPRPFVRGGTADATSPLPHGDSRGAGPLEEAEVDIVSLGTGRTDDMADSSGQVAGGNAPSRDDLHADPEEYARFRDIADEASVEIVKLDGRRPPVLPGHSPASRR